MAPRKYDTIVIGAGVAGLSAAAGLQEAGLEVAVVEGRQRAGGRIDTEAAPGRDPPLELGAEFIHGEPPEVLEAIHAAGLQAVEVDGDAWQFHDGTLRPLRTVAEGIERVMGRIDPERTEDLSFRSFIERYCGDLPLETQDLALAFVEGFHAAPADRLSVLAVRSEHRAVGRLEGERAFRIVGGYSGLVRWLAERCRSAGVLTFLDERATRIRWRPEDVEVETQTPAGGRRTIRAARAIVTIPPSLLRLPPADLRGIRFDPDVPHHRAAARQLDMAQVAKLVLRFRDAFWESLACATAPGRGPLRDFGFIVSRHPYFPTWWTQLPVRAPILTAWAGGPAAENVESLDEGQRLAQALEALSTMLGVPLAEIERRLEHASCHDWQQDPFSLGAYSYAPVGAAGARWQLAQPLEQTLFFAGEATRFDGETGTVAAAIASGMRVRQEILAPGALHPAVGHRRSAPDAPPAD